MAVFELTEPRLKIVRLLISAHPGAHENEDAHNQKERQRAPPHLLQCMAKARHQPACHA